MNKPFLGLTYLVIVAGSVGLSGYTTFKGYTGLFEGVIIVPLLIAVITATGLLACDLALREKQKSGVAIARVLVGLTFFMLASLPSHFHYFYSNAVQSISGRDVRQAAHDDFDYAYDSSEIALRNATQTDETILEVDALLQQLNDQINMKGAEGFGEEAQKYPPMIREKLPRMTRLARENPGPMTLVPAQRWYSTYKASVTNYTKQLELADPLLVTIATNEDLYSQTQTIASAMVEDSDAAQTYFEASMQLERQTQKALNAANVSPQWSLAKGGRPLTNPMDASLSKIADSIRAALSGKYPQFAIGALIVSLLMDLFPAVFALLLLGSNRRPELQDDDLLAANNRRSMSAKTDGVTESKLRVVNQRKVGE